MTHTHIDTLGEITSENYCIAQETRLNALWGPDGKEVQKGKKSKSKMHFAQWHPTPVLLPRESQGQRSLVGCHLWGHTESDTTERLHFHFSLSCIGEGNGKPLQCSCLENPQDRGAWWADVYGVAQSQT